VALHVALARPTPARLRLGWERLVRQGLSVRARLYLTLAAVTGTGACFLTWPGVFPRIVFVPAVLIGGLFLPPAPLLITFGYVLAWLTAGSLLVTETRSQSWVGYAAILLTMLVMYLLATARASLGLVGFAGERMLVDLRERQRALATLPKLPPGWRAEGAVAGARDESFSGDFLLCSHSLAPRLEVVLVDVSGKGLRAGTRSLMLSSALSGLLGQVPGERFLEAANAFLVRENWREGFATAVHVDIDLATGEFAIGSAGHPPAIHYDAQAGRWETVLARPGPVLGVMDGMSFPQTRRRLLPGDALLIYTDGVIESRTNQLADGIDWMLGTIERAGVGGLPGVAATLCRGAQGGTEDDRAVLLIWRE
jgi:hypothetical protein